MASFVFTDAKLTVNSVDLSDHVKKVTLKISADDKENTAMGATYKSRLGGLKEGQLDVEWNQDFAGGEVDATLFPLLGTVVAFTLKATSAANSATNPQYQGSVLIKEVPVLDGTVGDVALVSSSWPTSGSITRATS